jgi:hypothetical protein
LIVRYTDPPKQLALGGLPGKVQQTQQQPAMNPASTPVLTATAQKK